MLALPAETFSRPLTPVAVRLPVVTLPVTPPVAVIDPVTASVEENVTARHADPAAALPDLYRAFKEG